MVQNYLFGVGGISFECRILSLGNIGDPNAPVAPRYWAQVRKTDEDQWHSVSLGDASSFEHAESVHLAVWDFVKLNITKWRQP